MQVETQSNMKSQAAGVRKSSDGIDSNCKQNKRMKLSHDLTDNNSAHISSFDTSGSHENSIIFENQSITIPEENVCEELQTNGQFQDTYLNGSLNNGDRSNYEEKITNGDSEETLTYSLNENDSTTMDVSDSLFPPPPTLVSVDTEPYNCFSSNASVEPEKVEGSLRDFNEPCPKETEHLPQIEQSNSDNKEIQNISEISIQIENAAYSFNTATEVIPSCSLTASTSSDGEIVTYPEEGLTPQEAVNVPQLQVETDQQQQEETDHPGENSISNHKELMSHHQGPSDEETIPQSEETVKTTKKDDLKYLGIYDFKTTQLEGHADVIFSVAADDKVVISSSGDTTVKVWSVEENRELHNFAGHSDAVTSVKLLNSLQSKLLAENLSCPDITSIAISVSMDCHIKIWSVTDAKELCSIYTYNSITCMDYLQSELSVVIGTEGGKLETWNLSESKSIDSVLAHESSVSNIKVHDNHVYSVSSDGAVKVWLFEEGELQPLYSRKRRETSPIGFDVGPTNWKSVTVSNDILYLGDSTPYLKILNWRLGRMSLLTNQKGRKGICDAVLAEDNILLSTTYNSNTDTAGINVWSLPDMTYIGTLSGDVQDIFCLAMVRMENKLRIVSGGHQLIVWDFNLNEPRKQSSDTSFLFSEIEGIGAEIDERPERTYIHNINVSPPEINNNEDRRNRCNII